MKIIECPRDAMQGLLNFISTADKVKYINQLLKVGFDTIDFGSFVSAKAIPQLRDTVEVLNELNVTTGNTKLLAIVANVRGAEEASRFNAISFLGFPLSISETFQQRNTNKSISEALNAVEEIQNICIRSKKKLVVYISMGFGNPYGDPYNVNLVSQFVDILVTLGVDVISIADTIGISNADTIFSLFSSLSKSNPLIEIGAHLHSNPATAIEKIDAAYRAGCTRFDGAINGLGGCPMAEDDLVGNLATETILTFLESKGEKTSINKEEFNKALNMAAEIFPMH